MAIFGKTTEEQKKDNVLVQQTAALFGGTYANAVLRKPRITEKAYALNALNCYVFEVDDRASKPMIKRAVEAVYGVHVVKINIVRLPSRTRRFGKSLGKKSGIKKALVEIKDGESMTLFQAGM